MYSAIRRRFESAVMVLGVCGLFLGILGCQSGPKPDSSPGGKTPINWASSSPSANTATEFGATSLMDAFRYLAPDLGRDQSVAKAEFALPDSLKNWVGIGLTCTRIVDEGKEVEMSGKRLPKPFQITVEEQGKFVDLKVPGPQPGIIILSTGEVFGGLAKTLLVRFYSPAVSQRKGQVLEFTVVRYPKNEDNAPFRLQRRLIEVWQRTTRLQVLERSLKFSSPDGQSFVEFSRP